MRLKMLLAGILLGATPLSGATATVVRDWGLHRQWKVEYDAGHPERPARLVEIPWSSVQGPTPSTKAGGAHRVAAPSPVIRPGMRVKIVRSDADAAICLDGKALTGARLGEEIAVQSEIGHATLHGVVRGSGVVELMRERKP